VPKTGLFTNKPSDRFMKIKTADPFSGGKKHKTNFGYVYSSGGVPCHINHSSVNHKITWDKHPTGTPHLFVNHSF
jgi:Parkin co-regulated protein